MKLAERCSKLVAVYSRDQGRADAFAENHGADAAYSDLDSLLADSRIDAVSIASPNHLHAPQAIRAAAAGKHVSLAEKPMANTVSPMLRPWWLPAGTTESLSDWGFELRFHPAHRLGAPA